MQETTPKDLYNTAYSHYESKEYDHLLEICTLIFSKYPNSKEAKWAIKNFPITWDKEEKTIQLKSLNTFQQHQSNIYVKYAWIFSISILTLWLVASFFFLDPYAISFSDRHMAFSMVWALSLLFVGYMIIVDNIKNVPLIFFKLALLPLYAIGSYLLVMALLGTFAGEVAWWILMALIGFGAIISMILIAIGMVLKFFVSNDI
ncbi:MAG: hypothetical protein HZC48_09060 [Nitrospirae bacterium]|nr:hypothetical protein [Nitrospirota bacterium]